jgi:glycogen debranching enzyme
MHTRRYHGLLVAALEPPRRRHVLLSHVDVTVTPGGPSVRASPPPPSRRRPKWELFKHQFPGVDPESTPFYLDRFDQDPLPRWTYKVEGAELEITLALVRGENAVVLRYALRREAEGENGGGLGAEPGSPGEPPSTTSPLTLSLRPLLAERGFHQLCREHGGMIQRVELRAGEMRVQPRRDLPRICFRYEGTFVGSPDWWRRFEYLAERDRGLDFEEDLWTPGIFEVSVDGGPRYLVAAVDRLPDEDPAALLEATRTALIAEDPGPASPPLVRRLALAAEAFRADLAPRPGVIAGYPWSEVWGRDTLAALPGLYLVTGKVDAAVRVVRSLIAAMAHGLVPSRFPEEGGAPDYHGADATLWLFEAARHLADAMGDRHAFVLGELLPALHAAFEAALQGTLDAIHVTPEGLFAAGRPAKSGDDPDPSAKSGDDPDPSAKSGDTPERPGDALTWMDARVDGKAVTPRAGCPVELTALWARGADTLARLAVAAGDRALADRAAAACARARAAFQVRFWCAETSYPYDVVSEIAEGAGAFRDASVRPNAVVALAVDPDCFTPERADALLARARRELLTPAGLRTLAPGERGYAGRYAGNVAARDGAYHQGTVWPWLLGAYVRASLRRGADPRELEALVSSAAANVLALGQVPEVAGGDPPHSPGGCVAQAWSVAELLRTLVWDLARKGP